ncbi:MAG: Gfo/Idh/MocA family oxidoreductase [Gammaproteobacteria bacterium]|nr:Gfo/Idh/MocA family oxidoreductase [Gammaproteobacteria bacterium]MYH16591.1 Gfo/Idh/MocA family oxidoreductase [Gammaproteobacteria bacterium]MYK83652.1 Gfo/Idh/MocA family oxidoreductase [Gammaproteobacteria bacterium]
MSAVRVGIIGLGNIGQQHAKLLSGGAIEGAALSAVCGRGDDLGAPFGVPSFPDHQALIDSGLADAVLIATPTQSHPEIGLAALKQGLHVLMEKPLAMSIGEAQGLVSATPERSRFAVMLNQRFHPAYARIKTLVDEGRLGPLQRFAWTMTSWYRPDVYYKVSKWRGTWPGEGGGLLINQCIHNLDVLQWLVGQPDDIFAVAGFGRYHEIDVEDEVTATLRFANGLTGTVTASSGEAPGINQLDLVGDLGTLRFDGERIRLYASAQSVADHCANTLDMFGMPEFTEHPITPAEPVDQHAAVLRNFVDAIARGEPLATPAAAGLPSIELANAMLLSAWRGQAVALPLDAEAYEATLQRKIASTSLRQPAAIEANIDMAKSYR